MLVRAAHRLRPWVGLVLVLAIGAIASTSGCRNRDQILVPNRVLDRPMDLTLACVRQSEDGGMEVLSLNICAGAAGSCFATVLQNGEPVFRPQLVGFVTNSQRNELAMFRRCDRNALVDLDPETPGYNFVPVGSQPERITRTTDSCRVVTSNRGSCDLSIVDVPGLAAFAFDVPIDAAPSALVSTVVPRRSDGTPLGARPGDIVAVPRSLSGAADEDDDPFDEDDEPSDGETGDLPEGLRCDPNIDHSVWVTFPTCNLIAEVSLGTQRILQSRKLVTQADGSVVVEDTGPDPQCPIECPAQFPNGIPESPPYDPFGVNPDTIAFVAPIEEVEADQPLDTAEELVTYASLFVGGIGSDFVFEIPLDGGDFAPPEATMSLQLENAQGIHGIRVSPPGMVLGEPHQFLYVIAGDGSTHVVDRDFDEGFLGVECDTQVDPTQVPSTACHPIDPNAFGNAPDRRPFAVGPGIRTGLNAPITDWSFHKVREGSGEPDGTSSAPFGSPGIVGVGVTTFGRLVYSHMGQYEDLGLTPTLPSIDPVETMRVEVRPHTLWPSIDPHSLAPEALPRVTDDEPARRFPGEARDAQVLAPNLRQVDRAYARPFEAGVVSEEQERIANRLSDGSVCDLEQPCLTNVDRLAGFEDDLIYEESAPRIAVRDYQLWRSGSWQLAWEGQIVASASTGVVQCDNHGGTDASGNAFAGGTCRSHTPGDARLVDEGATFCEGGVLAGDTLVVQGCIDDDGCGLGQRCLREPTAAASATGVCISAQDYEANREELRVQCAPFISDPCGLPMRQYRIVRAFTNELWIQAVDRRRDSIVRETVGPDGQPVLREYEAKLSCAAPIARREEVPSCTEDDQCTIDPYDATQRRSLWFCDKREGENEGVCKGRQPDAACSDDDDCSGLGLNYVCVDQLCRAPCDLCPPPSQPASACIDDVDCGTGQTCFAGVCHLPCTDDNPGCIETPLPGPRCFPEFVRYRVDARDSFVLTGSNLPVLTDNVRTDLDTGECLPDPTASTLAQSRLWLGADEDETFNHPVLGIPDCPNPLEASPTDPNPCRIATPRTADQPNSLFHSFRYLDEPVEAIRYSNAFFSLTIDLTSLVDLGRDVPEREALAWPVTFARYRRSRIPRGYRIDFGTQSGYVPYDEPLVVANQTPVTYPVRIVPAPELSAAYIVDSSGRGGVQGVRGQIVRVLLGDQTQADTEFRVQ